jgi:HD-GYP domain-containing protein (c-di-GMP phosphodiesterase class II)
MLRYLPHVLLATAVIAGIPVALAWILVATDLVSSPMVLTLITVAVSLLAFRAGAAVWKRHSGSVELLFGELMLWGWLRRLWTEWRLDRAARRLEPAIGSDRMTPHQRAERLRQLSAALEAADPYTHGHSRRVARYSATIAKGLHLPRGEVARIHVAAEVHDVGKVRTPAAVLRKPGRLTDEEFQVIQRHAADGAEIVEVLEDPDLTSSVRHHHERLDGSGYPAGLSGEQIPLGARIIAVADTFDAIASTRPYRNARTHRDALAVLSGEAGTHLDPKAVRAFVDHYSDSRPLAIWTVLATLPERVVAAFGGVLNAGSAAVASLAVAAVAGAGAAAAEPPEAAHPLPTAAFICPVPDLPDREAPDHATVSRGRPASDVRPSPQGPAPGSPSEPAPAPAPTLASAPVSVASDAEPESAAPTGAVASQPTDTPASSPPDPPPPPPEPPDPPAPPPAEPPSDPPPPSCNVEVVPQAPLVCLDHVLPPPGG